MNLKKYHDEPAQPGIIFVSILSPSKIFQSVFFALARGGSPVSVGKYLSISGKVTASSHFTRYGMLFL